MRIGIGKNKLLVHPLLNYGGTNKVIVAVKGNKIYGNGSTKLYVSTDNGQNWASILNVDPDYFTVGHVTPSGTLLFWTANGQIWRSADNGTSWTQLDVFKTGGTYGPCSPPLYGGIASNGSTIVWGEYNTVSGTKRVFTSTDDGATWANTLSKVDPVDIRHWHSCTWIPSLSKFLITSGDNNPQVRWWTSPDGITWTEVPGIASQDQISQKYRSLNFIETGDHEIMWGSDAPTGAAIYKANLSDANVVSNLTKLYDLPHACWGLLKGGNLYVAVTSVETGDVDTNATVHTSKDGVKWQKDKSWAKRTDQAYGGFRSIRYSTTGGQFSFNIQYLNNTTTQNIYSITAVPK